MQALINVGLFGLLIVAIVLLVLNLRQAEKNNPDSDAVVKPQTIDTSHAGVQDVVLDSHHVSAKDYVEEITQALDYDTKAKGPIVFNINTHGFSMPKDSLEEE